MRKLFLLFILSVISGCASTHYFERCNHPETGGTSIPFSGSFDQHVIRRECAPDVLYSWQSEEKIDWKKFPENPLREGTYLYTWRTPLSTYAYGNVQIRLKVRKNIDFRWIIKNKGGPLFRCPAKDQDSTIYVLTTTYEKVVSEYVICSPKVLESWSVHTKGAYYEAQNEYDYVLSHHQESPQKYDAFGFGYKRKRLSPQDKLNPSDSYFLNWDGSILKWGDAYLKKALNSLKTPTKGKIFGEKPEDHFKSDVKTYFELTQDQLKNTF